MVCMAAFCAPMFETAGWYPFYLCIILIITQMEISSQELSLIYKSSSSPQVYPILNVSRYYGIYIVDWSWPQGADLPSFPLSTAKAGRNAKKSFERVKYPLPSLGYASQTISNLCQASLLRRCELPYKRKC
jgi:hypothetical protein